MDDASIVSLLTGPFSSLLLLAGMEIGGLYARLDSLQGTTVQ